MVCCVAEVGGLVVNFGNDLRLKVKVSSSLNLGWIVLIRVL